MKNIIILISIFLLEFNFIKASTIVRPKASNSVYLVAFAKVGYISDINQVQVELARVGFEVVNKNNPLEIRRMTGPRNNEQLFAIQIYEDGKIIYYGLRNPKRQGELSKALCEMFIQGRTRDDFFSALIGSAQFRSNIIKSLKNINSWEFYSIDSGSWTFGRVYILAGKKPKLYINCYEKPDYVFFRYLWHIKLNGIPLDSKIVDNENHANHCNSGDNVISLDLWSGAASRYFYFIFDCNASISCDEKQLDVLKFNANFIGDFWQK